MKEKTIIFQYNVDSDGNPTSTNIEEIAQVSPLKYTIQLEQIPDEQYGVILLNEDNTEMVQVFNYDEVETIENSYYVNYTNGIVYFNSVQGSEKKVINYYGTGVELISCKRVFDGYYDANGKWVTEILQDVIDAGREAFELMKSVGDIVTILQLLETKIAEGDAKLQELQNAIDESKDLTKVTGNEEVIINTSDWASDGNGGYYAIANHNCNSENIHVTFKRTATKENMTLGYTIIDNNSFKVFNHENVTTSCIVSAMYYRATQTISDDIAQEVVQARGGESSLGDRLNKLNEIDILINKSIMTFDDFGAKGDGVTDDTEAFKKGVEWSKNNGKPIYLLNKIYLITSVDISGSIIRSIDGVAGMADPMFLSDKNRNYIFGTPNWNYYYNKDLSLITWENMINKTAYGCCVISNTDAPIMYIDGASKFDIDGFAIIGNHRLSNQVGLFAPVGNRYIGAQQKINNINVIGCGSDGIRLLRGFETSTMQNVRCSANNGHGLYVGYSTLIDTPCEYLDFLNCVFANNRLDGVFLESVTKNIFYSKCDISGNGQYSINEIDPLLGYNRVLPNDVELFVSGIKHDDGRKQDANATSFNINIENCYGEMMAKGVHFKSTKGVRSLNNINIMNNTFYPLSSMTTNGTAYYFDVGYGSNWHIGNTYNSSLLQFVFKTIPSNGGEINIFDRFVPQEIIDSGFTNRVTKTSIETTGSITANRVYDNKIIYKDVVGVDGTTLTTNAIKDDFTKSTAQSKSCVTATYLLTANWQASNLDVFGGYLLFVTKLPSGKYKMLTLATSATSGFSSVPSMGNDGILNIPSASYYRYSIQRIDNLKTN